MAITYVAAGTLDSDTTTVIPGLPAGIAANDILIMQVVSGSSTDATVNTPTGWDYINTVNTSTGTFGADAGPRRLTFLAKIYAVGDTAPTIDLPSDGINDVVAAQIFGFHRSAGTGWRYGTVLGEDITSGTGFGAVTADTLAFAPGDFVLLGYVLPNSALSVSAEAIVATGATFGTITERADVQVSDGYNLRFVTATGAETAGTVNVVASINATLSGAGVGVAGVIRLREATSSITVQSQGNVPPRFLISGTGLALENIVTVTLQRLALGTTENVRGAIDIALSGDDAFVRTDSEFPFGTEVLYQLVLVDIQGDTWYLLSDPAITTDITDMMLSDALSGIGVEVRLISWEQKEYGRDSALFNVNGRIVVVARPRSSPTSTLIVVTSTNEERLAMNSLLSNATNGVLQVRQQHEDDSSCAEFDTELDAYIAITNDTFVRNGRSTYPGRRIVLSCIEVDAWSEIFEARGSTLNDIYDKYPTSTLLHINQDFVSGTLLTIAQYDWTI
jgi:hypothetical protein